MQYFTDFKVPKTATIAITNIIRPIAYAPNSHPAAWPKLLRAQLRAQGYKHVDILYKGSEVPWDDYDIIILEHGMEFKGGFNIFGGKDNEHVPTQLKRLAARNKATYSADIKMPDFYTLGAKRFGHKLSLQELQYIEEAVQTTLHFDRIAKFKVLYLGDSHILSVADPKAEVSRNDGKTLFGALTEGLKHYLQPHHRELVLYFGNIDIRHHLMRQPNPGQTLGNLIKRYFDEIEKLKTYNKIKRITLVDPLFIEAEERKLPKTGWFKGTPFFGTWSDRARLREIMTSTIEGSSYPKIHWDRSLLTHPDGDLKFEVMEGKSSVHLSPEYYQWDYSTLKPNTIYGRS